MSGIIEAIDALIDEQLEEGEPRTGADYGDPTFPQCPHCRAHWHGLPVTYDMAVARKTQFLPESYTYEADQSGVWCLGSNQDEPCPPLDEQRLMAAVVRNTSALMSNVFGGIDLMTSFEFLDAQPDRRDDPPRGPTPSVIGARVANGAPYLFGPDLHSFQDGMVVGYEDLSTGQVITGPATMREDGHGTWTVTIGAPELMHHEADHLEDTGEALLRRANSLHQAADTVARVHTDLASGASDA